MEEKIPIPEVVSYHFSFEDGSNPEYKEWSKETKKLAGMYGIALGLAESRTLDVAVNIFDKESALQFAVAATKNQNDTAALYGYTNPVLIIGPDGRQHYHSTGLTPGQI